MLNTKFIELLTRTMSISLNCMNDFDGIENSPMLFMDVSPHVKSFDIRFYKNGWNMTNFADYYEMVHNSSVSLEKAEKVIEEIEIYIEDFKKTL